MALYYLMKGKTIISDVDMSKGDVTALPLVAGKDAMSLVSADEVLKDDVAASKPLTAKLAYLGLTDARAISAKTQIVGAKKEIG